MFSYVGVQWSTIVYLRELNISKFDSVESWCAEQRCYYGSRVTVQLL